jgi:TRAP-type uncharacterized transport system fused permease subunit
MLLGLADQNQMVALFFAMCVSIILGMGMPTTAAYAVAASVIGPGLSRWGSTPLTAHFFIFYYAVMSAITPPVALAAYAGAAIAQSDPDEDQRRELPLRARGLRGAVHVLHLARDADAGGMERDHPCRRVGAAGHLPLSSAVQGWFFGLLGWPLRIVLAGAALSMIAQGWATDLLGLGAAVTVWLIQKRLVNPQTVIRGAD